MTRFSVHAWYRERFFLAIPAFRALVKKCQGERQNTHASHVKARVIQLSHGLSRM